MDYACHNSCKCNRQYVYFVDDKKPAKKIPVIFDGKQEVWYSEITDKNGRRCFITYEFSGRRNNQNEETASLWSE